MGLKRSAQFDLPLALLREEIANSNLLPTRYAQYRPLLADGLRFFLERLPPQRLARLLIEQARMPQTVPIQARFVSLLHHLPTLHKVGQVLARDRRLDLHFRRHLQRLESLEPRTTLREAIRLLDAQSKGWRRSRVQLTEPPLAEGSVAVILPFVWQPKSGVRHEGVFKLLKPGIESLLHQDLAIWGNLGAFLDQQCERYHLPPLDYQETFETVRDLLLHEIRLDEEQSHLSNAARFYTPMTSVIIPGLLPFSTPRMTAMERIRGQPFSTLLTRNGAESSHLAPIVADALIAQPLFSAGPQAFFHGDPHAGNLFASRDGRLAILDWSLVGRWHKQTRVQLVQLLLGAMLQEPARMHHALAQLSTSPPDSAAIQSILHGSLRSLRWGRPIGMTWLTELLDAVVLKARTRVSGELLLFRKTLLTIEGVLADLLGADERAAAACIDQAIFSAFLNRFVREWPERLHSSLHSRHFGTQLSSGDLLSLFWSAPWTLTRYYAGAWADLATRLSR